MVHWISRQGTRKYKNGVPRYDMIVAMRVWLISGVITFEIRLSKIRSSDSLNLRERKRETEGVTSFSSFGLIRNDVTANLIAVSNRQIFLCEKVETCDFSRFCI